MANAERGRAGDAGVGVVQRASADDDLALAQQVHHQFGLVHVGQLQLPAAIVQPAALLLGVPLFVLHPACALRGEAQLGQIGRAHV